MICQGDGNNMLILENGEKLMEDGLETKAQFPSWLAFILSIEKQEKAEKTESAVKSCILILDQPRIRNKSFLGYRWHVLTLRCKWMPTN